MEYIYSLKNKVRIVTAASLFDGHDASINIMRRIIQSTGCEVIHLGHDRSVKEVVDITNKITGGAIKYKYGKRRLGDAENLVSDISKFHQYINWTPRYNNLSTILKTAINWEKKLNAKNF